MSKELTKFLDALPKIPWLKNVKKYHKRDPEVYRHFEWHTWFGPETPGCFTLGDCANAWHKQLVANQGGMAKALYEKVSNQVIEIAKKNVPEFKESDSWYAPCVAVYNTGLFAGLMACAIDQDKVQPLNIDHQWNLEYFWSWYIEGHWPNSFMVEQALKWEEDMRDRTGRIVVL